MSKFQPLQKVKLAEFFFGRKPGTLGTVEQVYYGSGCSDHYVVRLADGAVVGGPSKFFEYANLLDALIWEAAWDDR